MVWKTSRKSGLERQGPALPTGASRLRAASLLGMTFLLFALLNGCKTDNLTDLAHGYPEEIAEILRPSCAASGCHTAASAPAAAQLNLESWDDLFKGSSGGSPVVPYSPEQSYFLYAINNDSTRGPILLPTMPIQQPALNPYQYEAIRQWIADGARNSKGEERFPPKASRRKWYVAHRGCELVAVIDAESRQVMRYVKVGEDGHADEQLNCVKVAPDGRHWYAVFAANNPRIEQYSTLTDQKVSTIALGHKIWHNMAFSADGRFAFLVSGGFRDMVAVDLEQGISIGSPYPLAANIAGLAAHPEGSSVYVTKSDHSALIVVAHDSNGVFGSAREVDLVQGIPPANAGELMPYDIAFSPDGRQYFVSCWQSHEIRAFDSATDTLLQVIPVGVAPTKMAISAAKGLLLVTCMEETWGGEPTRRGAVAVIDLASHQLLRMVYSGYQPHGIAVDETSGFAVVANRNLDQNGPAQHHASTCAGRNGNITLLDLNSLEIVSGFKAELSVDPYSVATKE
ncbi:MAG TPA: YncE family protein [Bacteroidia bacterium]|nr:YncE family protein [Bacteroidia bacterium]